MVVMFLVAFLVGVVGFLLVACDLGAVLPMSIHELASFDFILSIAMSLSYTLQRQ